MLNVFFLFFFQKQIGKSGGASRWMVCYQRGLPRLVFLTLDWADLGIVVYYTEV